MFYKKVIFSIVFSLFIVTTLCAKDKIKIEFLKGNTFNEEKIKKQLENSFFLDTFIATLNNKFKLEKTVLIEIGSNDGPLYENHTNKILIPYSFYTNTFNTFKKVQYNKTGISIENASIDVLIQTILHELAHAFIDIYNLPIVGNEENIADSFAAVMLIELFKNGDDILLSSADIFKLYSNNHKLENDDFIDEHSLDIQRFYDSLCYAYGSYPKKYNKFLDELNYTQERKDLCIEDYIKNVNNWFIILKKHLK